MPVPKAVIPAAGLGTRFLPATKAIPKEMIPIVDKPGIQYAVEECVRSGIHEILIVTGRGKSSIEDHFDRSPLLEHQLDEAGKDDLAADLRAIADLADVHYIRQKEPLGFGHAVLAASSFVGDSAFAVLVPDEIVPEPIAPEKELLRELISLHERFDGSVIAVQEVPHEDVSAYGVIDPEEVETDVHRIKDMIEKPPADEAPSDLVSRGRYVFTAELFDHLRETPQGVGGEIQLTDGLRLLMRKQDAYAYVHRDPIYDVGKKLDYLKATIELALRRNDLAAPLTAYLRDKAQTL